MDKPCTFCDRTQFEERLIYESDNFNIIATLGQITDGGYVLLSPKAHILCCGAFGKIITSESLFLAKRICRALIAEYKLCRTRKTLWPVIMFEHGIVGQTIKHGHMHFIPAMMDLSKKIRADFPAAEIDTLQYAAHLQKLYSENPEPYLFWTNKDGRENVCWNPPAPPQYLRILAAKELGHPERANWRTMDQELDRKLWQETVHRLKPYFIRSPKGLHFIFNHNLPISNVIRIIVFIT